MPSLVHQGQGKARYSIFLPVISKYQNVTV
nr:unnamed protein product [Callosobruchus analis]